MSDIEKKGVWVFQADIKYDFRKDFQEGEEENWKDAKKTDKLPGQIILFRQTRGPPEKMGIYGIGKVVDTKRHNDDASPAQGVNVRYLKRFDNFITLDDLRKRAKEVGIDKTEYSQLYQFIFGGIPSTDIWFGGKNYEILQQFLPKKEREMLGEFLKKGKELMEFNAENLFQKMIEQEGGQIIGVQDSTTGKTVGWPDFAVRKDKKIVFYEIKSEDDKVSESQREMLRMLRELGAEVHILFYEDEKWVERTELWLD